MVNVRAIPSAIVERVEVLTGGASAIYGSDAVAGVVNIVTRKNYEGNQIRLTAGTTGEGGGDSMAFEYTGGTTGDRWSALYALQYNNSEPVYATQREFLRDTRNNPYGLAVNPNLALVALSLLGNSATRNHNAIYDAAACDAFGYTTVTTATRGTYCGSYTQPASRSISNKQDTWAGYLSGTFDITDSMQLFGSVSLYLRPHLRRDRHAGRALRLGSQRQLRQVRLRGRPSAPAGQGRPRLLPGAAAGQPVERRSGL